MTQSAIDLRRGVLITADELHEAMRAQLTARLVVLDVRWSLAEPDGRRAYFAGHIPGAQYVDLDRDLSSPAGEDGRHPLPAIEDLQTAARRWGINDGDLVVVYDDSGGTAAARAWWLLRWGGLNQVRILDGGLHAWHERGGILEDGSVSVAPGTVALSAGNMPVTDTDGAARFHEHGVLLDARSPERYTGQSEPIDPRPGHIPGALNAPTSENLRTDQTFLSAEELRQHYRQVGVDEGTEVAVYCGSGVTATHEVAALTSIGVGAALYPGSYSQWCADDSRPVVTGLDPLVEGDEPAR